MARKGNKLKTSSDMLKRIAAGLEGRHFGDAARASPQSAVAACKTNKARERRYPTASVLLLTCFAASNCFLEEKERERENIPLEQFYFGPFVKNVAIGVTWKNRNKRVRGRVEETGKNIYCGFINDVKCCVRTNSRGTVERHSG